MTLAIELTAVTKRFGSHLAVHDLDLAVPQGAIYGFIGPNGSGKTTTLRMILRMIQPDSGSVCVLGRTSSPTADDRLGYLPEERGLYKRMRVRPLLAYLAHLKGHRDCAKDIEQWLERLGASIWAHQRIDSLSKGMAQKVQFIAAVIARPQLLILDEPFSGLDPVNLDTLRRAIVDLSQQGTTIVLSTHDMDLAEELCDTIFMIFRGRKVLDGTLDSIQANYPANRLRVRFAEGHGPLPSLRFARHIETRGRFHELELSDPKYSREVLRQLSEFGELTHFEVVRPSLHEIFVRIARPEAA